MINFVETLDTQDKQLEWINSKELILTDEAYNLLQKGDGLETGYWGDLEKAKDLGKLHKVKKLITRDGKTFLATFWEGEDKPHHEVQLKSNSNHAIGDKVEFEHQGKKMTGTIKDFSHSQTGLHGNAHIQDEAGNKYIKSLQKVKKHDVLDHALGNPIKQLEKITNPEKQAAVPDAGSEKQAQERNMGNIGDITETGHYRISDGSELKIFSNGDGTFSASMKNKTSSVFHIFTNDSASMGYEAKKINTLVKRLINKGYFKETDTAELIAGQKETTGKQSLQSVVREFDRDLPEGIRFVVALSGGKEIKIQGSGNATGLVGKMKSKIKGFDFDNPIHVKYYGEHAPISFSKLSNLKSIAEGIGEEGDEVQIIFRRKKE